MVSCGVAWRRREVVWRGAAWHAVVWHDMVLVWHGWRGVVWRGIVWLRVASRCEV